MPTTQSPLEPGQQTPEPGPTPAPDPNAPLTFVPHEPPPAPGEPPRAPVRFRTNRYGELEEHELVRLLDTIEDERARGRFRESIYISMFFWIAVAWVVLYGPKYLWHAPKLISPVDAIRQHELTQLNLPSMHRTAPPAPKAVAPVNRQTIKQLQTMTRAAAAAPTPAPTQPSPAPPAPSVATSTAPPTPQPLPSAPQPRTPAASVPDAPTPQPNSRPGFNTGDTAPGGPLGRGSRPGSGSGFRDGSGGPLDSGAEILSDTQGVDFGPYIRRLLADIKRNWEPLLPEETRPPISKQGETYIRFKILPDGNIEVNGMHLDASTHDMAIDKSCWSAITSEGQFAPLPANFHGPNLELRIHFLVNKDLRQ